VRLILALSDSRLSFGVALGEIKNVERARIQAKVFMLWSPETNRFLEFLGHLRSRRGEKQVKIFLVGGAVRDKLLGKTPKDFDYLVLNSTYEEMTRKGYIRVGNSYEVFLHPSTKEEYVLADNLEADLKRRDLTMNSMAIDENGKIIDPFMGREDLRNKILRHTSEHFAEDPLRVYRVARFKAQFPDFSIAEDTLQLMRAIAKTSEFQNLHSNRIFNEVRTALQSNRPSVFFETLQNVGALFSEIKTWQKLDSISNEPILRFASLVESLSKNDLECLCEKLFVPNEWREGAITANLIYPFVDQLNILSAQELVELLYKMDAFRKSHLLRFLINLYGEKLEFLQKLFSHIKKVTLLETGLKGKEIGFRIKEMRVNLAQDFLLQKKDSLHA
jgi:tRNA nucleotidyltransferase (CCA-adding enzyme)